MAKTIKVIDLLNKMANKEGLPRKVLILDDVYYLLKDDEGNVIYSQSKQPSNWEAYIDRKLNLARCLNEDVIILDDEVEILEEQQDIETLNPEEAYFKDGTELVYKLMYDKINEIAMRVNKISKNIKDKE